jgi:hypothetical protein
LYLGFVFDKRKKGSQKKEKEKNLLRGKKLRTSKPKVAKASKESLAGIDTVAGLVRKARNILPLYVTR